MSAVFPPLDDQGFAAPSVQDSEVARLRIPPHSVEAESSVLGGLLLDNNAWDRVGDLLTESNFYRHEHQLIFTAIASLVNASKPADVITVFEHLRSLGKAEEVGGLAYLNNLAQYVPSASNIRRYAEIVRERSILRKLVTASDEISTNAFDPQGKTVERILDEAEAKIFAIGEEGSRNKQGFQSLDTLVIDLLDKVQEMADNPVDVTGIPTGFADLDRMTSGLQAGDMIVLAARPSMGKTAFAVNIAEHVALNEGLPVAIFSMASVRRGHSSSVSWPVRKCPWFTRPMEPTIRTASWAAPISMEKMATGRPSFSATCSAMFTANEVFPIEGRAANTIMSPACSPEVIRSRSAKPVGTPVTSAGLSAISCTLSSRSITSVSSD